MGNKGMDETVKDVVEASEKEEVAEERNKWKKKWKEKKKKNGTVR
jgi:hypothetical protein